VVGGASSGAKVSWSTLYAATTAAWSRTTTPQGMINRGAGMLRSAGESIRFQMKSEKTRRR
jgi:hypothetical protein